MGPLDILNHLLNFMAPAAFVALALVLCGRLFGAKGGVVAGWRQFAVIFAVGLVVLAGGLALGARDGKMLTYSALVVAAATCQWLLVRGWKG
ncbi:hypothetical protein [Acidovorax sp. FJL06]|uniref:hypothetical protein n=1 Tax=Acidovorax sp. FJL06 TaxID=2153365 RepID=UPI000F57F35E|nr:hypothetical protein [Acidovorax sp. FJL06]RQO83785.1 hypothetical protein DBV10_02450 [Acidovorax sp. FJL06]